MNSSQVYDPLGNPFVSKLVAALPIAALMGLLIMAQAYVWPFSALVVH